MTGKDPDAYRTISEVAEALRIPPHVLRFWETKFPQVKPLKRGGGRRFYRRADVDLLRTIRRLLHEEGYTIRGVQRLFKTKGSPGTPAPDRDAPRSAGSHEVPTRDASQPLRFTPTADPRVLIGQLAAEIANCQALLSEARRAPPDGDGPGPDLTRPPPAAAEPDVPASTAPPP